MYKRSEQNSVTRLQQSSAIDTVRRTPRTGTCVTVKGELPVQAG